ncbi:Conserved hypothetical protein CHP00255 [Posidoniimonas corsicana]|uniref:YicC-like family, N-terminal region n=1 Tax=Posidoniimonas corsicana TaxID=1938618 RepID=A0A5C5VHI4_9BACT|nr:YicC/YloC family endoribonuclease [Posidoniimonas corsicana]TWT37571.1 Conserved hypothetical protein CHP00255 [Posidoniimonas corsicana]
MPNTASALSSMTGFGEARGESDRLAVAVEVRTINSRHYKLSLRASEGYGALEPEIDAAIRSRFRRGTVQMNLRVSRLNQADDYQINADVLQGYHQQLVEIGVEGAAVPLDSLLQLPGVVIEQGAASVDPRAVWPAIEPVVLEAVDAVCDMRLREGLALADDLAANCRIIEEQLGGIEQRAPNVTTSYRERLTERVNKAMSELNVTVEPSDLLREVALFADRSDISEEVVRLRSHIKQFNAALADPGISGKKLEFIAQEMGRETNTIGSKANDTEISKHVVEIKTALERIREQVQNVE